MKDQWGLGATLSVPVCVSSVTLKGSCNEGLAPGGGASERSLVHEDANLINGLNNPLILHGLLEARKLGYN